MNTGKTLFAQLMDFLPGPRLPASSIVTTATDGCESLRAPNTAGRWP
jgi:hypothetical protein